jgi:hypothetical protein
MQQFEAGMTFPEGVCFYMIKKGGSKVLEIRSKVCINGQTKYLIDSKANPRFVDVWEFYTTGPEYNLVKVK